MGSSAEAEEQRLRAWVADDLRTEREHSSDRDCFVWAVWLWRCRKVSRRRWLGFEWVFVMVLTAGIEMADGGAMAVLRSYGLGDGCVMINGGSILAGLRAELGFCFELGW